jgi:hypothetical protein
MLRGFKRVRNRVAVLPTMAAYPTAPETSRHPKPARSAREDAATNRGRTNGQPAVIAAGAPASGSGVAIRGDVVRLLASLPDRGEIAFRVTTLQGAALEGRYALAGLKIVLERLAVPCKWPTAAGAPRN